MIRTREDSFKTKDKGECLSPVKLCHNLIDRGDQNYGSKTVFGRRYFEATARG